MASAKSGRFTLPARLRRRHKGDFDAAYARGRRMSDGFFSVTARVNEAGVPRLGLAVAVKVAGSGVARNRLRRIIRESFRLHQRALPAARAACAPPLLVSSAAMGQKGGAQCSSSPAA